MNDEINGLIKTLAEVEEGRRVILVGIEGGFGIKRRLTDMGLTPGEHFTLLTKSTVGPYVILLKGSRVAIGRGMARSLKVKELTPEHKRKIRIALAGNPNSGKTTIFNNFTGFKQHVGNYPGVTVEKREGLLQHGGYAIDVVDLPGTYSLSAYSIDELVARHYVVEENPDVVIDIVDSSNLERNLYLTLQFIELGVPVVVALNMSDVAKQRGFEIDEKQLSRLLGIPFVPTVGNRRRGMDDLLDAAVHVHEHRDHLHQQHVDYGEELETEISKLEALAAECKTVLKGYPSRWIAIKLLERDDEVLKKVKSSPVAPILLEELNKSLAHLRKIFGDDAGVVIAEKRYGFISGACQECMQTSYERRHNISDKIDAVLTNHVLGLPIFLGLMWLVFQFVFKLAKLPMEWIEGIVGLLGMAAGQLLPEGILQSLVVDGVIAGVGGVIVFLPNIMLLFLAIAFLEDSGYMARAAFIVDRFMHKIGLHGKSFIPMLIGFGCTVPAVMATRTLESRKDRLVTMFVTPLMSCGARLPIYTLLIGAFFPQRIAGNILFSIYLIGIVLAVLMAKIFRRFLFPGPSEPFVMELPPYRLPTFQAVLIHMWMRTWQYLKKAGTIILLFSILFWFLMAFPQNIQYSEDYNSMRAQAEETYSSDSEGLSLKLSEIDNEKSAEKLAQSYAGRVGRFIEPVIKPLGFDWRVGVALFNGFAAKELVVSTMSEIYAAGTASADLESLRDALRNDPSFNPLIAYTMMIFTLLYVPCIPAMVVIWKESGRLYWMVFVATYTIALAWLASFIVYQGGKLLGLG